MNRYYIKIVSTLLTVVCLFASTINPLVSPMSASGECMAYEEVEYSHRTISEYRYKALQDWEKSWFEICDEIVTDGKYDIILSGINEDGYPVESDIYKSIAFYGKYYYPYDGYTVKRPLFDTLAYSGKWHLLSEERSQNIKEEERKVVEMFKACVFDNEELTVRHTVGRVRSKFEYDIDYAVMSFDECLTEARGVCWAFANIGMILLCQEGIPARVVSNGYHAWVEAYYDNDWHSIDFTDGTIETGRWPSFKSKFGNKYVIASYESVVAEMEQLVSEPIQHESNTR